MAGTCEVLFNQIGSVQVCARFQGQGWLTELTYQPRVGCQDEYALLGLCSSTRSHVIARFAPCAIPFRWHRHALPQLHEGTTPEFRRRAFRMCASLGGQGDRDGHDSMLLSMEECDRSGPTGQSVGGAVRSTAD